MLLKYKVPNQKKKRDHLDQTTIKINYNIL